MVLSLICLSFYLNWAFSTPYVYFLRQKQTTSHICTRFDQKNIDESCLEPINQRLGWQSAKRLRLFDCPAGKKKSHFSTSINLHCHRFSPKKRTHIHTSAGACLLAKSGPPKKRSTQLSAADEIAFALSNAID